MQGPCQPYTLLDMKKLSEVAKKHGAKMALYMYTFACMHHRSTALEAAHHVI